MKPKIHLLRILRENTSLAFLMNNQSLKKIENTLLQPSQLVTNTLAKYPALQMVFEGKKHLVEVTPPPPHNHTHSHSHSHSHTHTHTHLEKVIIHSTPQTACRSRIWSGGVGDRRIIQTGLLRLSVCVYPLPMGQSVSLLASLLLRRGSVHIHADASTSHKSDSET